LVRKKLERSGSKRRIFSLDPEPSRSKKLRGRSGSVPSPLSSPLSAGNDSGTPLSLSDGRRRHLPLLSRAPGRLPAAARRPSCCRAQVVFLPRAGLLPAAARMASCCRARAGLPAAARARRLPAAARREMPGRLPAASRARPSLYTAVFLHLLAAERPAISLLVRAARPSLCWSRRADLAGAAMAASLCAAPSAAPSAQLPLLVSFFG
jgi:hypothetical protein